MASLGSLVVTLAADTARFQGDLGRAAAIAESRMRNIKDTASRALGALTVAASAAGVAMVASLKAATDRADDFRDFAAGAGVTVETFSRLQFAARQSGVETETLAKALAKLAAGGSTDAAGELASLADQFRALPDGATKTAKAIELFGERLGPGLVPLLNEGSEGIRRLAEQSDALGNTITTSTAAAADEFNDNLGVLSAGAAGFGQLLAAELLPTLNGLTSQLLSSATASGTLETAARAAAAGIRILITVADAAVTSFLLVGRTFGAVGAALAALASGDFSSAAEIVKGRFADIRAELSDFSGRFEATWVDTGARVAASAPTIAAQLTAPAALAAAKEREILRRITQEREEANATTAALSNTAYQDSLTGDVFAPLIEGVRRTAVELDTGLVPAAKAATDEMTIYAERAAENMQDAFADFLFDPFEGGVKGMLSSFTTAIRRMVAEAASAEILRATGITGLVTGVVGSIFGGGRASGGPVNSGRTYRVGEKGPELITMGGNGYVTPNDKLGVGGPSVVINQNISVGAGVNRAEMATAARVAKEQAVAEVSRLISGGAFAG